MQMSAVVQKVSNVGIQLPFIALPFSFNQFCHEKFVALLVIKLI